MHGDESDERVRDARHSSILKEVEVWVKSIFISNCATKPSPLSLAALGFLGNSIKAYREARPLVEIVRCSGFIIATLSWLLVSIFPHEPNAEITGALWRGFN